MSKPYTLTLTLSLKGEGINGWTLIIYGANLPVLSNSICLCCQIELIAFDVFQAISLKLAG
jgi:hypothetical protein